MALISKSKIKARMMLAVPFISAAAAFLVPPDASAQVWRTDGAIRLASPASNNLKVSFTHSPKFPKEGQAVQFADSSSGAPTSWAWDFGDGTTSTLKNPSHVFANSGFRRVTLIASSGAASKRVSRTLTVLPDSSGATFVFSPSTPSPGQTVQFADTTSGTPDSWQWDFGDGGTSSVKNPSHAYGSQGSFTVTLLTNGGSGAKRGSRTITVAKMSILSASFTYAPSLPETGQTVQFTDGSAGSPTSWLWDFGDGTTSSSRNPGHVYTTAGAKTVTLTVADGTGSNATTRTVTIAVALSASFAFSPASPTAGQAVQFTDTSAGTPASWLWNFGDGTISTVRNPSHTYTTAGSKTVNLTVANASGSRSASRIVPVTAALSASFNYSPAAPTALQQVQFTDTSIGTPTNWQWSFGDGSTSVAQNPVHAFASAGTYTVTLTAMNASGSQSVSRAIAVGAVLVASFSFSPSSPIAGQAVQFTDTSTGTPSSWSWSFGDGSVSTLRNPTHAYAVAGLYPVSLTATAGSNSQTTILTVQVAPSTDLAASFSFSPSRPAPGQSISFTDTSSGEPTSWQWNFGDGSSSAVRDPSHAYAAVGTYNVTLITANASGSDTVSRSVVVAESAEALPAERVVDWTFSGVPGGIPARATVYRTMTPAQSAAEINAAIASCPAGQVVALAAGTYQLGQISFGSRSGVTLRGAGPGRTIIMTAASNAFTADEKYFFSEESIALANDAGLAKGSTWITLASAPTSAFAVGNLVMIDQADSPDALGSRGVGVYHRSGLTTPWNLDPTRCLRFTTRITGVSGTRISLATPVPYTFSQALSPRAMALRNGPGASQCGIEDLSIVGNGTSNRAVSLSGADRCWVKNVEASNFVATNGTIFIEGSSQCEVRRCYVHDCVGFPSQADGYAYFLYYGCGYCRIEDNIAYRNAYSILNGSAGNAVLYNYDIDARRAAHLFLEQSQICNHGPHGIMNLYEGNIVQRFQNDGYHGSTSHTTLFRNHVTGVSASVPSPTNRRLIDLCRGSYFHNVVGNIIGDASWTPSEYEYAPGEPVLSCVYILGFPGMDSGTMTAFTTVPWADWSKPTNAPDADVAATLLRHGNYDYLNRDTVWSEGIAARDLPASLVYSTKPAYFGTLQWPPIGPDVSGLVSDIPAKARWSAFMRSGNLGDLF